MTDWLHSVVWKLWWITNWAPNLSIFPPVKILHYTCINKWLWGMQLKQSLLVVIAKGRSKKTSHNSHKLKGKTERRNEKTYNASPSSANSCLTVIDKKKPLPNKTTITTHLLIKGSVVELTILSWQGYKLSEMSKLYINRILANDIITHFSVTDVWVILHIMQQAVQQSSLPAQHIKVWIWQAILNIINYSN